MTRFSDRLLAAKQESTLTWDQVAARSGYSESYIRDLASGARDNPTLYTVECLAQVLNKSPSHLAGWE